MFDDIRPYNDAETAAALRRASNNRLMEQYKSKEYTHLTLYAYHIFTRPYLLQSEGRFKNTPKRTTSGGVWLDGYSDHLPTVTYLVKVL